MVQGKDRDIDWITKELASLKMQHQATTHELSVLQIEHAKFVNMTSFKEKMYNKVVTRPEQLH